MEEIKYMRRCFELAQKGMGNVAPNPMVGAVIVHNGEVIGEGYHMKWGGPHAEVNAVASVKDQSLLKESKIYVSLEPCSHYGKTPPCAKLIIEKGIPEVIVANVDPFPEVAGRGIKMLETAGVKVKTGILEEEGWIVNRRFFTFHQKNRPFIILKWAQSEDGFMDNIRENTSPAYRFSNEFTQKLSHQLRANEAAILVGTQTALMDNPSLTVRHCEGTNPTRIIIDRKLKVPFHYNIYNGESPTLVFTEEKTSTQLDNTTFIQCEFPNGRINIQCLLDELYKQNLQSLIVEGGSQTLQSFIEAGLWDEMQVEVVNGLNLKDGIPAPSRQGDIYETIIQDNHTVYRTRNKLRQTHSL